MTRPNWHSEHPEACTCTVCQESREFQFEHDRKIGRNEKCPCDSGLKYKKCHGQ